MNNATQNQNNTVPVPPKPPPGGGDAIKVNGPFGPSFALTNQMALAAGAGAAGTSTQFMGDTYTFINGAAGTAFPINYTVSGSSTPLYTVNNAMIMPNTQPAVVVFNNVLCLFWTGYMNDGIWYATSSDGQSWSEQYSVGYVTHGIGISPQVYVSQESLIVGYFSADFTAAQMGVP
ncbi:hypothetical protein JRI60_24125 [Archangium violaceum]|uniref:hypothetical protein n=1 Tax=Archangium violaceum TaxID=83451 RepID=UPI001950984E|nr:hypothetical protein [Archangium violaceum]QRO01882.1 hypothetical protein JRI60_24125 [Archangium violaceum]